MNSFNCLEAVTKELKRQKDEYLKRLKSCSVRGLKELKKVKKKQKG